VTINKGEPVYVFSAQGDLISVKRALNTGDSTSAQTLGLAAASIAASAEGLVVCQGVLTNVDTSTYTAGQGLYLGATAGSVTTTKPSEPNHLVYLGFVEKVNASSGRIYVRVQNGYELDEIHDVNINNATALANNHLLRYNSTSTRWENAALDIVTDTTPQLGGSLDVNGNSIVSASNGNITLAPNGTGKVIINGTLQVDGTTITVNSTTVTVDDPIFTLGGDTAPASDDGKDRGIEFRWHNGTTDKVGFFGFDDSTGYLTFIPDATNTSEVFSGTQGDIQATNFRGALIGNATTATTATNVTIVATGTDTTMYPMLAGALAGSQIPYADIDLKWDASANILVSPTVNATNFNGIIGATTAAAGTFTDLTSTGKLTFKQPIEAIYDLGTTGGTIAPNCVNGSVQKITLSSALTLNAFTSPVAGQSLTLIIYGGTAYTSITSTMKFAGGVKTLTGTASCIDIVSIYYDGTNYFASLGKGFA
jgi:hypothetical protein